MKSAKLGKRTSDVEITNVSKHGFWLLIGAKERFVPFEQFPWFRDAPIGHLLNVELPSAHHLYWPDLDVDIAVESLDHPDRFPLIGKVRSNPPLQRTRQKHARR
jgi:hypothetical protein